MVPRCMRVCSVGLGFETWTNGAQRQGAKQPEWRMFSLSFGLGDSLSKERLTEGLLFQIFRFRVAQDPPAQSARYWAIHPGVDWNTSSALAKRDRVLAPSVLARFLLFLR